MAQSSIIVLLKVVLIIFSQDLPRYANGWLYDQMRNPPPLNPSTPHPISDTYSCINASANHPCQGSKSWQIWHVNSCDPNLVQRERMCTTKDSMFAYQCNATVCILCFAQVGRWSFFYWCRSTQLGGLTELTDTLPFSTLSYMIEEPMNEGSLLMLTKTGLFLDPGSDFYRKSPDSPSRTENTFTVISWNLLQNN